MCSSRSAGVCVCVRGGHATVHEGGRRVEVVEGVFRAKERKKKNANSFIIYDTSSSVDWTSFISATEMITITRSCVSLNQRDIGYKSGNCHTRTPSALLLCVFSNAVSDEKSCTRANRAPCSFAPKAHSVRRGT